MSRNKNKQKLECPSCDHDIAREEIQKKVKELIKTIEEVQKRDECFKIREYVECPPGNPPPPRREPHPYIPGRTLWNYPSKLYSSQKVTIDGRLAQPYAPERYYFEDLPMRVPPWSKPRYPSIELRGGVMIDGCDCWKRNGLQDDCRRWDCDGRPECAVLACPPSIDPPIVGVRHKNGFEYPPRQRPEPPMFGPFPQRQIPSVHKRHPPVPPMKAVPPPDLRICGYET